MGLSVGAAHCIHVHVKNTKPFTPPPNTHTLILEERGGGANRRLGAEDCWLAVDGGGRCGSEDSNTPRPSENLLHHKPKHSDPSLSSNVL